MRCQSCSHEWRGNYGENCPQCGALAENPFDAGGGAPQQSSGPSPWEAPNAAPQGYEHDPGDGIPWENQQSAPSMLETLKAVLLNPAETFAAAHQDTGIGPAFTYALILGIVGGMIGQLWSLAMGGIVESLQGSGMEAFGVLMGSGVVGFVTVPIYVVIGLFMASGILHVCLMIVGGANRGFEATFRVVAYAQGSAALLQLVPLMGPFIGAIWGIVVQVLGIRELHQTTTGKAVGAVLLPLLLCVCCMGIAGAMFASALAGSSNW